MAQCAKIGVAKADLFPSFSLFGSIGFLASDVGAFRLSDLLTQQGFMLGYLALIVVTGIGFASLPTGFLPEEDQGYAIISVQLPPAASLTRTAKVIKQIDGFLQETPGIADWITFGGLSILDSLNQPNMRASYGPRLWLWPKPPCSWSRRPTGDGAS